MDIRRADLDSPAFAGLLEAHRGAMRGASPPDSQHALAVDRLRGPDIVVWTLHLDGEPAGCAALRSLEPGHAEIKSMRTAPTQMRRGVARALLAHAIAEARRRGDRRVSIETGTAPYFAPARALYRTAGFVECGPFGDYATDPNNVYMTLPLA